MKRISNVDLRLLRIFASVVESNGFTAAQLDLNISVSSISTYIAALEERLGVRLCQRGRTGFALTEKGAIIYREAKRLFATLDEFGVMAATVRGGRFNNRDHEVTIEVSVGPPAELQRGVLDGSLILRWPAFLPRSPNWSPSRFMAKSIDSTVAPATACSTARQSASTISPAAGSSRSYWRGVNLSRMGVEQPAASVDIMEAGATLILSGAYLGISRSIMPRPGSLRASCAASFPKN